MIDWSSIDKQQIGIGMYAISTKSIAMLLDIDIIWIYLQFKKIISFGNLLASPCF